MQKRQLAILLLVVIAYCGSYGYIRRDAVRLFPNLGFDFEADTNREHLGLTCPIAPGSNSAVALCNTLYFPLRKIDRALTGIDVAFYRTVVAGPTFQRLMLVN